MPKVRFRNGLYRRVHSNGKLGKTWWVRYYPQPGNRRDCALHRCPELNLSHPVTIYREAREIKTKLDYIVLENRRKQAT